MTSTQSKPKITVITVCYNAADVIEPTILSVIGQDYGDVEYIVIDGASTDGTVDIISRYAGYLSRWISEPDKGIYHAMNKGISIATGDYILFMNAGDRFFSHSALSRFFSSAADYQGVDVLYGDTLCSVGNRFYKRRPSHTGTHIPTCHQSIFVAARRLKEMPFDLSYRILADRHQFRQLRQSGITFAYVPEFVSIYDTTGISNVHNRRFHSELCRLDGKISSLPSFLRFRLKKLIVNVRDSTYGFLIRSFPRLSRRLFPTYTANYFEYTHTYPLSHFR
ncbi:MAG: glycosyltransferase [Muribaculaceae bacterium]|nr:glycosyltransferase [Muribaculaceae bacterium]